MPETVRLKLWLTGTAPGTGMQSLSSSSESPAYTGLEVDPCIPADWKDSACHAIRGATYKIEEEQRCDEGCEKLVVDGKEIAGNIILCNNRLGL